MTKQRHIVVLGNSVVVGALSASLQRYPKYQVITLSSTPDPLELEALMPDVMIFDLESTRPEAAFALLESCHGVRLIGISPDSNLVRVWSGRQLQELSTNEVLSLIDG